MTQLDYQYFANLLKQERDALKKSLSSGKLSSGKIENDTFSLRDSTQEISVLDNHPGDIASELFERSKDFSLHDRQAEKLYRIELALKRISEGTYGICSSCGRNIDPQRLEVVPSAECCIHCEEIKQESTGKTAEEQRPVEESFLYPPFTPRDDQDTGGYDVEDAWEEVAEYGTSSSPQDDLRTYNTEENGYVDEMDKLSSTNKKQPVKEEEEDNGPGNSRKKRKG